MEEAAAAEQQAREQDKAKALALEEQARAEEQAKARALEEQARAEEQAKQALEKQAREQEQAKARALQEQARAEEEAKQALEKQARAQEQEKARVEEEEAKARAFAEEQARAEEEAKARVMQERAMREVQAKTKALEEFMALQEQEKARVAEEKAKEEAKARAFAEEQAREQHQAKARALAQQQTALEEQNKLIEAARQKKTQLAEAHESLVLLEQQLRGELKVADAIMQNQVQPKMPGNAGFKVETSTPQTPRSADTQSELSEQSQDAQNPWLCRKLFPSPEPIPNLPQETQATLLESSQQSMPPAFPKASSPGAQSRPCQLAASPPGFPKRPPKASVPPGAPKASPAAVKSQPQAPPVAKTTLTKRLLRCMEPTAKGTFKVSKEIRDMYAKGGRSKERVYELFAQCGNQPDSPARFVASRMFSGLYTYGLHVILCNPMTGSLPSPIFC